MDIATAIQECDNQISIDATHGSLCPKCGALLVDYKRIFSKGETRPRDYTFCDNGHAFLQN